VIRVDQIDDFAGGVDLEPARDAVAARRDPDVGEARFGRANQPIVERLRKPAVGAAGLAA
jgi:hypothetical protein